MRQDEANESVPTHDNQCFAPLVNEAIVLTGPTASGKSSVALELAQQIDGEILSLDSIAVYRSMDIGTAKPSKADQQRVPHHLIDLVEPDEEFSVVMYLRAAHEIVSQLRSQGKHAIFVGGTPMFLKGVLRGFDPGPPADWDFRNAVEADVQLHGAAALHDRLRQVDPVAAHNIDANDIRRMIRALEVARYTGVPLSHRQVQFGHYRSADDCLVFGMQVPRDQLHQRIKQRVDWMFEAGLVDEVKSLIQSFGSLSRTASKAVGYRELIECFAADSETSSEEQKSSQLETARQEIAAHTRQLARRQETWFRSFAEIRQIPAAEPVDVKAIATQIAQQIRQST